MSGFVFLAIIAFALIAGMFILGYSRNAFAEGIPHSRPIYHAVNAAIWTGIPALVFYILWVLFNEQIVSAYVLSTATGIDALGATDRTLFLSEVRQVASGIIFKEPTPEILAAAERLQSLRGISNAVLAVVAVCLSVLGLFFAFRSIAPRYRARHSVERSVTWFMMFASLVAIVTTLGIIASLVYEAGAFFAKVPFYEFLFGTRWEPQIAMRADQVAGQGAFGMLPVLFGTIVISLLAMALAVPVGIFSAIYLTEYANPGFRSVVKPLLEILAGIPTVVYGFFAVLTVAPLVRMLGIQLGIDAAPNSALAAGLGHGDHAYPVYFVDLG